MGPCLVAGVFHCLADLASEREIGPVQLFQRRRWVDPRRLTEGHAAFVRQLEWIDAHTSMDMAGWRLADSDRLGAILATTTYDEHAWFLEEKDYLQTLSAYSPVNNAAAALTVGEDTFERWDTVEALPSGWSLDDRFWQVTDLKDVEPPGEAVTRWTNVEGAADCTAWLLGGDGPIVELTGARVEYWERIH